MVGQVIALALATLHLAKASTVVNIEAATRGPSVNPGLFGLFLEEINHACEGGLYGELIQNRGFADADPPPACSIVEGRIVPPRTDHWWEHHPVNWTMPWDVTSAYPGWKLLKAGAATATASVEEKPLNDVKRRALHLAFSTTGADSVTLSNEGYWGIGVRKGEDYLLRLYGQNDGATSPSVEARLVGDGDVVLASSPLGALPAGAYGLRQATLHAAQNSAHARFELVLRGAGDTWFSYVSLFPKRTFRGRANGLRPDLAKMIADLKPGFIRFPGGCYVEGLTIQTRAQWKDTIGPLEARKPTYSPWGYWNTNGFGFNEWLEFCEDIGAKPLYVFNDGVSCAFRSGTYLPDDQIPALIQDTLDALEYANGPVTSTYGAMRANAGHPKPFNLRYVEIGNEESGAAYGRRFAEFAGVVKQKYPECQLILSSWISGIAHAAIDTALGKGPLDIVDEHAYTGLGWVLSHYGHFDTYPRSVPWQLYIGEFACNAGVGTGNVAATLNDAAYMMDMERNGDLVKMGSYAPLLQREESSQWDVNLIHFDSGRAYGRASYYACKMMADNLPSYVVPTKFETQYSSVPKLTGSAALGSFNTAIEFKDLAVTTQDGTSASIPIDGSARIKNGAWSIKDGLLSLPKGNDEGEMWTFFGSPVQIKTLTVKARKISGPEGFLIGIGDLEGQRVQLNFGGWGNSIHAVQINSSSPVASVRGRISADRWYAVRIEVEGMHVKAWLNDRQVIDTTISRPDRAIVSAGIDEKAGELVVKVVNAVEGENTVKLNVNGVSPSRAWMAVTVLTSTSNQDENSLDQPFRITPKTMRQSISKDLVYIAPPHSFSILRIKIK